MKALPTGSKPSPCDPRNVELLDETAFTYAVLRQFPAALKLLDRALDIVPNDPELMAFKAAAYQAEGNLQEAAKLLVRGKRTDVLGHGLWNQDHPIDT